jgi:hypothetical protein
MIVDDSTIKAASNKDPSRMERGEKQEFQVGRGIRLDANEVVFCITYMESMTYSWRKLQESALLLITCDRWPMCRSRTVDLIMTFPDFV